jgi:hypothetical protein
MSNDDFSRSHLSSGAYGKIRRPEGIVGKQEMMMPAYRD